MSHPTPNLETENQNKGWENKKTGNFPTQFSGTRNSSVWFFHSTSPAPARIRISLERSFCSPSYFREPKFHEQILVHLADKSEYSSCSLYLQTIMEFFPVPSSCFVFLSGWPLHLFLYIASKILLFRPVIKLSSISQSAKNRKSGGKKGTGNWTGPFFRTGSQWCTFSSTAVFWGSWYQGGVSLLYSCETHVPVSLPSLGQRYLPAFFGDLKPIKNPLSAKVYWHHEHVIYIAFSFTNGKLVWMKCYSCLLKTVG